MFFFVGRIGIVGFGDVGVGRYVCLVFVIFDGVDVWEVIVVKIGVEVVEYFGEGFVFVH